MGTVTYPHAQVAEFVSERFVALKFNLRERHPDFKEAVGRAKALWSPLHVYLDGRGNELRRTIGYLPPEEFLAELRIALGLAALMQNKIDQALVWFEDAASTYPTTLAAPEALYWAAAAAYRTGGIPAVVARWDDLASRFPDSPWTRRVRDVVPPEVRAALPSRG